MDGGFVVFKSKMVGFKYTHTKNTHTHTKKMVRILKRILTSKLILRLILHNEKHARGFLLSRPLAITKKDCNLEKGTLR